EIAVELAAPKPVDLTDRFLLQMATSHNLYGLYVFGADSNLLAGVSVRMPATGLPDYVLDEVKQLIAEPENNYILLLDQGATPDQTIHYYLEISNQLDRVTLVVADALYYTEVLEQTQIGFLAQSMSREQGVEYIMYQTTEGIIFSSRKTGEVLAIESDPFLAAALESETITHRVQPIQGKNVLELVRPFSSAKFPFGLLRVGLSLDGYYSIQKRFDRQMIGMSAALVVLLLLLLLYLNSRQKRKEIARRYRDIKSITDRIFDEMQTGVAYVDGDGRVSLANEAFCRLFGGQQVVGRPWDDIVREPSLSLSDILSGHEDSFEREVTIGGGDKARILLVAISRFTRDEEHGSGTVVVIYDITRLKEYELEAARRERLSEMGNLAAGVAHEIRNPLNTISIAAQRLASEFQPEENREEYASFTQQIRAETGRLNEIITRFLALARVDKKKHPSVRLDRLVEEHFTLLKLEADKLGMELTWVVEDGLAIEADPGSLRQMFSNLFNNTREAFHGRSGKLEVQARSEGNDIVIELEDNGPGVPVELREKIFAPYFTTKEGGTGLGLAAVHKVVSDMGGRVRVGESRWGGARFSIVLPVQK
ncbi:MAG: ATP-binding protein, partial [candidate division Zixibacteria bacterium]|nr:ATP-binding protein [candidate division Zixibacteria bacterium]